MAGGISWFMVACLIVSLGVVPHQPAGASTPVSREALQQITEVPASTPGQGNAPFSEAAAIPAERQVNGALGSFQKPPACPPLPDGEDETANPTPILPVSEQGLGGLPVAFDRHGTQVAFAGSLSEAARQAVKDRKLLFVLHLSGNFEDAKFT
jgi:hypothetical protein